MIMYNDVNQVFAALGVCDFKVPKGQSSTMHLDYAKLDLCSIRLINRMIYYLGEQNVKFSIFIKDIVQT